MKGVETGHEEVNIEVTFINMKRKKNWGAYAIAARGLTAYLSHWPLSLW